MKHKVKCPQRKLLKKMAPQGGGGVKEEDEKTKDGEKGCIQQRKRRRLQSEGGGSMRTVDGLMIEQFKEMARTIKRYMVIISERELKRGRNEIMKDDRRGGEKILIDRNKGRWERLTIYFDW